MKFIRVMLTALLLAGVALAQDTINVAWPYQLPPDGHFNMFATGRIDLGIYHDLMSPPLAVFLWSDGEYEGIAAESFGFDDDGNYTVTLVDGASWSDGTPMTAADMVATFNINYLIGGSVWDNLESVEAVDGLTASFTMAEPSLATERLILTENIRPAHVYQEFADAAAELIAAGADSENEDFQAALEGLTEFRPEEQISGGPFKIDDVSDARVRLVKNEGGLNADIVAFDEAIVWNGETEQVFPLVQDGQLWYATHGFAPAQEEAHINRGLDIIRPPMYSGPALYFNYNVAAFNDPVLRQAIAHAVDREENGFVSLGESGVAVEYMTGISDNLLVNYLDDDTLDSLNTYDYDPEAAAAMLEEAGYSMGDDGVWVTPDGERLAFEMIFPAEFADWSAAAENAAQALNDFGVEITARGVQFQQQVQDVYDGEFEIAIRNWGAGSPFAYQSYLEPFRRYNGQGEIAGEGAGGGMNFNNLVTYSGGEIDMLERTIESSQGNDNEAINAAISELAVAYNELLPVVPLWERYGNNPLNREQLNAPEAMDGIYLNAGADHFMPYMILTGKVTPAGN